MKRTRKHEFVLVLALYGGYYALIAGMSVFIAMLILWPASALGGFSLSIKLAAPVVAGVLLLLRSFVPRRGTFRPPGPRLKRATQPVLFRLVDQLAMRMHVPVPDEIYLYNDFNAAVLSRNTVFGCGGKRVLLLGLPLFGVLNIDELRSVIAHELGHFASHDTRLGALVEAAYRSLCHTHETIARRNPWLSPPFRAYLRLFLRVVGSISRKRELHADEQAALAVGRQANLSVERRLNHWSTAYNQYWRMDAAPMFANGFQPPLLEGFRMFLAGSDATTWVADALERNRSCASDPHATHPSSELRIVAFEAMPDDGIAMDARPAAPILANLAELEQQLVGFEFGRYVSTPTPTPISEDLQTITWEQIGEAYSRRWDRQVAPHKESLFSYTLADVPKLFRQPELIDWDFGPLSIPPSAAREQRINLARGVLIAATSLAMIRKGWRVDARPGRQLSFLNPAGIPTTGPWHMLARLIEPGATDVEWMAALDRNGLRNVPLSRRR